VAGAEIWVAQGTYKPTSVTTGFSITKKLKLYGGFAGGEASIAARPGYFLQTILEGDIPGTPGNLTDNAEHVVTVLHVAGSSGSAGVVIDGFHIRNGYASSPGNSLDLDGGGIYSECSDLDLSNCFIRRNSAHDGGGLYFTGGCGPQGQFVPGLSRPNTLHIKLCEFGNGDINFSIDKNTADHYGGAIFGQVLNGEVVNTTFLQDIATQYGGGVFLWRMGLRNRLDFTNCVFWRNHANAAGGAMYLGETAALEGANAKLVNCTFAQNSTSSCIDGTALNVSTHAIGMIYNSIFWHNYAPGFPLCGGNSPPIVGNPTVEYSDVQLGWTGTTNIISDPLFVSFDPLFNLRLSANSLCLDHADYTRLPLDSLDVDGDGSTSEVMPIDEDGAARLYDDGPPGGQGNPACPPGPCILDMGAYERHP
jgi:predicted outer membrane repeat protein